jgi:hypothetical protein
MLFIMFFICTDQQRNWIFYYVRKPWKNKAAVKEKDEYGLINVIVYKLYVLSLAVRAHNFSFKCEQYFFDKSIS